MEDTNYTERGNFLCRGCKETKHFKPQKQRCWNKLMGNYDIRYGFRCDDCQRESTRKWRRQNPQKHKAHGAVFVALRNGFLKREPCQICGEKKVQAHHVDYELPLDVIWYCHKHHVIADRLAKLQGFL